MELSQNLIAAFPALARRMDPAQLPGAVAAAPAPNGLGQDVWMPTKLPAPLDTRYRDMINQLDAMLKASKAAVPVEPAPAPKAEPAPAPKPEPAPAPKPAPAPAPKPAPAPATYTVKGGDSLSKIAKAVLGDGNRWREIYDANRDVLSNPDLIHPGQTLKIPGASSAPAGSNPASAPAIPAPAASGKGALAAIGIPLSDEEVAKATGAPLENVKANLPYVVAALKEHGITSEDAVISVLATIAVETGNFKPITEFASGDAYEGRKSLGNTQPGDGRRFKGRGYIQITGRYNYEKYGKQLGVDLVNNPALALDPKISAQILALYFKDRNIPAKAERGDVEGVRRAVNGGTNGLARFETAVNKLEAYA